MKNLLTIPDFHEISYPNRCRNRAPMKTINRSGKLLFDNYVILAFRNDFANH